MASELLIVKGYDPINLEPIGPIDLHETNDNDSIACLDFIAEGGTYRQSFFINCTTDSPYNLKKFHLYNESETYYETNIQIYAENKSKISSPLGDPRLRYYVLSPSASQRIVTLETSAAGAAILVTHLTLDEYENDFAAAITSFHGSQAGLTDLDRFLQTFKTICNVGSYDIDGDITYYDLYYNDPLQTTKRHKLDVIAYAELPFNNIMMIQEDYATTVSSDQIRVV